MTQNKLISELAEYCGDTVEFKPSESYYWSPGDKTIYYQANDATEVGLWTLLHETCHALLEHKTYSSDFELVKLEVASWNQAEQLADRFGIKIDQDHIQDCLDSYRDWQYKRSLCPGCDLGGVQTDQTDQKTYSCLFCNNTWQVSKERFLRPYRKKTTKN